MDARDGKIIIAGKNFNEGEMEDFKRSDHNDFALSSELRDREFCGVRNNTLTMERELWVMGRVVLSMPSIVAEAHPDLWEQKYAEVFALEEVKQEEKGN